MTTSQSWSNNCHNPCRSLEHFHTLKTRWALPHIVQTAITLLVGAGTICEHWKSGKLSTSLVLPLSYYWLEQGPFLHSANQMSTPPSLSDHCHNVGRSRDHIWALESRSVLHQLGLNHYHTSDRSKGHLCSLRIRWALPHLSPTIITILVRAGTISEHWKVDEHFIPLVRQLSYYWSHQSRGVLLPIWCT